MNGPLGVCESATITKKIVLGNKPEIITGPVLVIFEHIHLAPLLLEVGDGREEAGFAKVHLLAFPVMQCTIAQCAWSIPYWLPFSSRAEEPHTSQRTSIADSVSTRPLTFIPTTPQLAYLEPIGLGDLETSLGTS